MLAVVAGQLKIAQRRTIPRRSTVPRKTGCKPYSNPEASAMAKYGNKAQSEVEHAVKKQKKGQLHSGARPRRRSKPRNKPSRSACPKHKGAKVPRKEEVGGQLRSDRKGLVMKAVVFHGVGTFVSTKCATPGSKDLPTRLPD